MNCKHNLKHNKEMDFVFCTKCGKKWEILSAPIIYPLCPTAPTFGEKYDIIYC